MCRKIPSSLFYEARIHQYIFLSTWFTSGDAWRPRHEIRIVYWSLFVCLLLIAAYCPLYMYIRSWSALYFMLHQAQIKIKSQVVCQLVFQPPRPSGVIRSTGCVLLNRGRWNYCHVPRRASQAAAAASLRMYVVALARRTCTLQRLLEEEEQNSCLVLFDKIWLAGVEFQ